MKMKACVVISALCILSLVSAVPVHNGMVFYHMPYYNPYYQSMLMHYSPQGRSSSTSAFAAGDTVAAGSVVRENRFDDDASRATDQQSSTNDGNVEAIAEAYPEEPIQGTVQYDQDEPYNEVIPLNAAPISQQPAENISPKQEVVTDEPQIQTTVAPKKKVHIALDIPDNSNTHDETASDEDDAYPYAPQKPNKQSGGSPMYTFLTVSFGRAAGGTIAVANACSTGKGAVRSHAIAYGTDEASRRHAAERHTAARSKDARSKAAHYEN